MSTALFDTGALRDEIRAMYRDVAREPGGDYHFEIGRSLALRLGYPSEWLDAIPSEALASFAGVGHFLDLAAIERGDRVLDLGSGSGTDSFIAAYLAGTAGHVVGVDMTDAQLAKARRNAPSNVEFVEGLIESPPVESESIDVVISNGVINLAPDKQRVFDAAAAALRPGGRLALADIVSELHLAERTRGNVSLWAACIAGAVPLTHYLEAIEAAGLRVQTVRTNPDYRFISPRAQRAVERYGVTSVSVLAIKP
jgi:arsenite methyltransferase